MIDNTAKVGSAPWFLLEGQLYVGKVREQHYNLFHRLLPEDFDTDSLVCGRVELYYDKIANVKFYSEDKLEKDTKNQITEGLTKYAANR